MWEPWSRRREARQLEARLRSARPEPREEFVRDLAGGLAPRRQPRAWSRVAFAAAFTTFVLGSFASFGGIGYAASGASQAVQTLADIATAKKVKVHSAAADQYAPPPKAQPAAEQAAAPAAAAAVAEERALPFTGLSLVGTALIGIALIAFGLVLRRRERRAR